MVFFSTLKYLFHKAHFFCLLCFVLSFYTFSFADELITEEYQFEVNPQWYSTESYAVQGIIGASRRNGLDERNRVYARPSAAYGLTSETTAIAGLFTAYNQFQTFQDSIEVRPYLGVSYYHGFDGFFDKWGVSGYFRIEDRLRYLTDNWEGEQNWRARLRILGIYTLNSNTKENSWHRIIFGAEVLRTYFNSDDKYGEFDDNFDVESRLSLSIERTLTNKQKIRFNVNWRYQVPFNLIDKAKFSTVVFRIRYYPQWGDLFKNILSRNVDE